MLEERLLAREGTRDAEAFKVLDFYSEKHEMIKRKIRPGIVLEGDYDLDEAAKQIAEQ